MLQRFLSSTMCRSAPSWPSSFTALTWTPLASQQLTTIFTPQPPTTTTVIRQRSNRSRRGLYDGKDVRFGNNVPFSMKKTRRRWNPNVQHKRVYSEVLDEMIRFHLTTGALRTMDKMGGLDNYLLRSNHVSTKGEGEGQRIRNRIMQKMKHREGLKTEAAERGEQVEDWDKIVMAGKKIKQPSVASTLNE